MPMRFQALRLAVAAALLGCSLPLEAKTVTMGSITVDVPDGFQASESSRGMEVETPNKGVMIWFETYKGSEDETLRAEHDKFWTDNDVVTNADPVRDEITQKDGSKQESFDYKDATWNGKPTILRYIRVGPVGAENTMILVTFWASPQAWDRHSNDVTAMIQSLDVTYKK